MARASWTGTINFGLVSIPVRLLRAVDEHHVRFRYLHRECRTPLVSQRYCPVHEEVIPWPEVVRGYEIAPGEFISVEQEEVEEAAAATARRHRLDLQAFVGLEEIDPLYYDHSYYADPRPEARQAYALLNQAMRQTARVGVGTMALRAREALTAVRPLGDVLLVQTLYYADEVHSPAPLHVPTEAASPRELRTAIRLIESLAEPFMARHFTDEYHRRLMSRIEEKAEAQAPVGALARVGPGEEGLLAELQASVGVAQEARREAR